MKKIGIVGIGKLGLCFALSLEKAGFEVHGVDVSASYVRLLETKKFCSTEPGVDRLLQGSVNFFPSTVLERLLTEEIDDIFIMVATPSLADGSYDHSQIDRVMVGLQNLGKRNRPIHLYIGCTTMPGYCDKLAARVAPYNYTVSYNPEFIAQGSILHDQQNPDQVLIGEANTEAGNRVEAIYRAMVSNTPEFCRMDRISAEIAKLATNCFLTTKISFANAIGDLAIKAGADYDKILSAIGSDSRIGSKYLRYGFGFGGPCFPRDNRALGKFAADTGYELILSRATDEVNRAHLEFQLHQYLRDSDPTMPIIFDSVTYKQDSTMLEESQKLALAVGLAKSGRKVIIRERSSVRANLEQLFPGLFEFDLPPSEA